MSWFGFGRPKSREASALPAIELERRRTFGFRIAGALYHQPNIARFNDGREHVAILEHEPENPHDANAVKVTISGVLVGHLHAGDAEGFVKWAMGQGLAGRRFSGPAMIVPSLSPVDGKRHLYVNMAIKTAPPRVSQG